MIHYAQFYHGAREGVGSDSILPLDGRLNLLNARKLAESHLDQYKYDGYELRKCTAYRPYTDYRVYFRSHT